MNWTQIEGKWQQAKGELKSKWSKLTDDDVENIRGKRDQLLGKLQERYGVMKEDAERQVDAWIANLDLDKEKARDQARKS